MQLNHEILSEKLVEDQLVGMSIIMIQDVIDELRGDPDFNEEAYRSILTAELQTIPKEMKDTCRMCQLEDEKACCQSDCKLFEKAVEFHELIDSDYDICYHCPEKDTSCLGYEHCRFRNLDDSLKAKDVRISADSLLDKGIINAEMFNSLLENGLRFISSFDYESVLDVVGSDVISRIQDEFFVLMERHFAFYLSGFKKLSVEAKAKYSQAKAKFEEDFEEYMLRRKSKAQSETFKTKRFKVAIRPSAIGNSYFVVVVDKKSSRVAKLLISENYISSQMELSNALIEFIEERIHSNFDENFKVPRKVYTF